MLGNGKKTCPQKVLPWYMKIVGPNFSKNQKYLLRIILPKTKCKKYPIEIITQKAGKYLKVWEKKTRVHLFAHLLTWYWRKSFPREFTEKYFAVFDQSTCTIYLMWYSLLPFFKEFTYIIPFMTWLRRYIFISSTAC